MRHARRSSGEGAADALRRKVFVTKRPKPSGHGAPHAGLTLHDPKRFVTKEEVMPRLLRVCPSFEAPWKTYVSDPLYEDDLLFIHLGEFSRHLVALLKENQTEAFSDVFAEIETLLREGHPYVENAMIVGLLEGLQNVALGQKEDPGRFVPHLGPATKAGWDGLNQFWEGNPGFDRRQDMPEGLSERILQHIHDVDGAEASPRQARQFGAMLLGGTLVDLWLLRADGTVWEVPDDFSQSPRLSQEHVRTMALVQAVHRYPWLEALVPQRPRNSHDCVECGGLGTMRTPAVDEGKSQDNVFCANCSGLGWLPDGEERVSGRSPGSASSSAR